MSGGRPRRIESDGAFRAATPRQLEVLRIIRDRGVITRAEIAELLGSSASQVSRLTSPLISQRLVTVEPRLPLVEGRPTELLALADDTHYVVGLDIGGLAQDAVVTNLRGAIIGSAHAAGAPPDSHAAIIERLMRLIDVAIAAASISDTQIMGAGAGVRAIIDPVSGIITAGPETPAWSPLWVDFDLRDQLSRALPWPGVVVDDTVRALAAAERRYGKAAGYDDFVYVLADTGIGATLMIDGHPYIGPRHLAGEIGHITLIPDGALCGCGRRGCVEQYASTSAMIEQGQQIDPSIATIEELIARADSGDERMRTILAAGGAALGRAIAILLNLLSPALIVLGGRAITSQDYLEQARTTAKAESLDQPFRAARIVTSDAGAHSGAQGAATLMLDELFSPSDQKLATHSNSRHRLAANRSMS
ncbi:MAG TPA: ROK family transcriptional regulator [Thermomicrobiales bacterium]|nr:ROK family transcriptional regulator [Thermomicrobiales bacterium]